MVAAPTRSRGRRRRGVAGGARRADRGALARGWTGVGAFLAWGDPSLYDGMIDVLERARRPIRVMPGISAVSALAARHRSCLNRVAGDVLITTGRRVAAGLPDGPTTSS